MERQITFCLLFLLLLSSTVSAAPTVLEYAPAEGATWTIKSKTVAKVPMLGTKTYELSYDMTCLGQSGDLFSMRLDVPAITADNGQTFGPVEATFKLSPTGQVSALSSPQMNDPQIASVLKNVGLLFPKLPGTAVNVGEAWTSREVFYLPAAAARHNRKKAPKLPDKVRLDATFKFVKLDAAKGAQVSAVLKHASGEPIKVDFKGSGYHKPEVGYGTGASFGGNIKVRKLLMWVTVPITVTSWLDE